LASRSNRPGDRLWNPISRLFSATPGGSMNFRSTMRRSPLPYSGP